MGRDGVRADGAADGTAASDGVAGSPDGPSTSGGPDAPVTRVVPAPLDGAPADRPWLVVIDPQRIFADPSSDWAAPTFPEAFAVIERLSAGIGPERTIVTRWLPTADRAGAWGDYFRAWPFADVPAEDPLYDLVEGAAALTTRPTVDEPTFGKWGPQLAGVLGPHPRVLLTGVSTDCCVIATSLAAADAGVSVRVVTDACAASTPDDGAAALRVMGLFGPQVELVESSAVLAGLADRTLGSDRSDRSDRSDA